MAKKIKFGRSISVKFDGCKNIPSARGLTVVLKSAAKQVGATFLKSVSVNFNPRGASSVIVLAESHYGCHSWPENGSVAFVLYTCGKIDSSRAIKIIGQKLKSGKAKGCIYCYDTDKVRRFSYRF